MTWSTRGMSRPRAAISVARQIAFGIDLNLQGGLDLSSGECGLESECGHADLGFSASAFVPTESAMGTL